MFHTMRRNESGTTLIEAIIAISIFSVVTTGLYLLIQFGIQVVRDSQSRLDALAIAESQIEAIKNVPYDDIGTSGGVPAGDFAQTEVIVRNDISYTLETDIRYVDDDFDDVAPTDTVPNDYKSVRVEVSWADQLVTSPVVLVTLVAPNGIETDVGGGTLWIEAYNAAAQPISDATVRIINGDVSPTIDITAQTDSNGRYILTGADASVESYQVLVYKSGYSSAQTYDVDPVLNPNPDPTRLTVIEDEVTTKTFSIDQLSNLTIRAEQRDTGTALSSIDFSVVGEKRIGTDGTGADIPKYSTTATTDSNGDAEVNDIEYDTYSITVDTAGWDFAGSAPHVPYVLGPNSSETITVHLMPDSTYSLLVTVEDGATIAIPDATVTIENPGATVSELDTTNAAGQVFFSGLTAEEYTIDISATGYDAYSSTVTIAGDEVQTIPLTAL